MRGVGVTPNNWSPPSRSMRTLHYSSGMLHIVGVPLIILASIGVGFMTVILKDVLLPFVIGLFLVYLLRPLVNLLTTPFSYWCAWVPCFPLPPTPGSYLHTSGLGGRKQSSSTDGGGVGTAGKFERRRGGGHHPSRGVGGGGGGGGGLGGVGRTTSPPKYPRSTTRLPTLARLTAWVTDAWEAWRRDPTLTSTASSSSSSSSGSGSGSSASTSTASTTGTVGGGGDMGDHQCGVGCGSCRMTRCPRWVAILVSLAIACTVLGALLLMIADAIQRFQHESLNAFVGEAGNLVDKLQRWLAGFGIMLEGSAILDAVKQQINVPFLVKTTVTVVVEGLGNGLLVLLLLLYLLAEQSTHGPNSLRARMDDQIQRYIGIKTVISAVQGLLVYIIMGYFLQVRMAHLIAVLHFILNFIPTAGPVIATIVPMPLVILDPSLSVTSRITAFLGPSAVHIIIGNFVEPMVFGQSMELHPVMVLLALALWYSLWGVAGAILAVPITAVIRIVFDAINHPYARIVIAVMEGRLSAAMEETSSALELTTDGDGMEAGGVGGSGGGLGSGGGGGGGGGMSNRGGMMMMMTGGSSGGGGLDRGGVGGDLDDMARGLSNSMDRDLDEEEGLGASGVSVMGQGQGQGGVPMLGLQQQQQQQGQGLKRGGGGGRDRSLSRDSTERLLAGGGENDGSPISGSGVGLLEGGGEGGGGGSGGVGLGGGGGGAGGGSLKDSNDRGAGVGWGFSSAWLGSSLGNNGGVNARGEGGRKQPPSPVHHVLSPDK